MRPITTPGPGAVDRGKSVSTVCHLGHLASGVGHHVINAFSAVVSNAEILRMKLAANESEDSSILADSIIRAALEASNVARRLIDVTRPLTDIGTEIVRLDQFISDYHAERSSQTSNTTPQITWLLNVHAVPPIIGNADDLRLMLDHLTTNSIEAAEHEHELTIGLSLSLDNRGWVALEIRDNGRGMSHEVLERAVEPFFSTKSNHLGVGLSLANGIWRRHKGTLSLRGMGGEGTTIRLCVEPMKGWSV